MFQLVEPDFAKIPKNKIMQIIMSQYSILNEKNRQKKYKSPLLNSDFSI